MPELFLGYLAAFVMGVTLSVLGSGGSILTIPILVYLCSVQATLASSYSLGIVGFAALIGAIDYARSGNIAYRLVAVFGVPSMMGVAAARGWLLPRIPEQFATVGGMQVTRDFLILSLFAVLMIGAGITMIRQASGSGANTTSDAQQKRLSLANAPVIGIEGCLVGILTGAVGVGGGFLIVPVLVTLLRLPMRTATGTSLAIICCKSLIGLSTDKLFWSNADWRFLMSFTIASVAGIVFGGRVATRVAVRPLQVGFGCIAALSGVLMLASELMF